MKQLILKRMALRKEQGKKGFTLIEVIVVLVILAILAAIAIPALTGYIDKANQRAAISQAAQVRTALQAIASDSYTTASGGIGTNTTAYEGATALPTGYSKIGTTNNFASEIRALTGTNIPAADAELTEIYYTDNVLTGFKIKIGASPVYEVTFSGATNSYTVA